MADMTLKHHRLIADALVKAIHETTNSKELYQAVYDKLLTVDNALADLILKISIVTTEQDNSIIQAMVAAEKKRQAYSLDSMVNSVTRATLSRILTNEMVAAFGELLAYSHDKFDKADFAKMVRDGLKTLYSHDKG